MKHIIITDIMISGCLHPIVTLFDRTRLQVTGQADSVEEIDAMEKMDKIDTQLGRLTGLLHFMIHTICGTSCTLPSLPYHNIFTIYMFEVVYTIPYHYPTLYT